MKVKHLAPGEARVIKLDRQGTWEYLTETLQGAFPQLFDLLTHKGFSLQVCWQDDALTCVVTNDSDAEKVDLTALSAEVPITTDSLFQKKRYCTIRLPAPESDPSST